MPDPITGIAAAGLGLGIVGTASQMSAADKAAEAQQSAAQGASATELAMYEQTRKDLEYQRRAAEWALYGSYGLPPSEPGYGEAGPGPPTERDIANWRRDVAEWYSSVPTGREGGLLGLISQGPGDFYESPGYQFRLAEGQKALERSAAARGGQLSGAQMKALQRYGQEYASNEYDKFLSRYYQSLTPYQSLANQTLTTGMQLGALGQQTASDVAQYQLAGGQARASGYINQANALVGGLSQIPQLASNFIQPQQTAGLTNFGIGSDVYTQTGAPSQFYGYLQ